jgi:hypothetical protein
MKKSFEYGFGILLAVAGFLTTGIAQTEIKTPVVLYPGYVSTKLVVTRLQPGLP